MLTKEQKRILMQRRHWTCEYDGKKVTTATGQIHHLNKNPEDDRLKNLKVTCKKCHDRITKRFR